MVKKISVLFAALFVAIIAGPIFYSGSTASAVTGADWQAGRIIDDSTFTDKNSMTVSEIQQFLNRKVGTGGYASIPGQCDTNGVLSAQPFANGTRANYAASRGKSTVFTCLNNYYEVPKTEPGPQIPASNYGGAPIPSGAKSAAQLIWDAGQANNISPKVLLVMIQKESAGPLTTDDWPFESQYKYAMGAYCPDSRDGPRCNANYAGFSIQIHESASLLRYYLDNMQQPWWSNKKPYQINNILWQTIYDGNGNLTNCGGSNVYIENAATAALYTYTPYQPNAAALSNMYGTGDYCSAYGNRNFWRIYNDWFGSTLSCESPKGTDTTLGAYNPGEAVFYERSCLSPGPATSTIQYGNTGWIPLSGDWNRDGIFTPGAYDPATGRFYLRNSNDGGPADIAFQYGNTGWLPLSGDWDGNGYWSIGLYDPATSTFYLKDFNGGGGADYTANFGNAGWKPITGDWDSNRSTTIGVYNPDSSMYYLNNQIDASAAERNMVYGNTGWKPIAGDWDGNGYWSIGSYDPNTAIFYLKNLNSEGGADITVQYGNAGWTPIVGDWDGRR